MSPRHHRALPRFALAILLAIVPAMSHAADPAATTKPEVLPLWPAGVPGTPDAPAPGNEKEAAALKHLPVLESFRLPAGERPRPAVIVCPGGGYTGRAGHEGAPLALWANSLGFHGFVCQYRVSPWRHPEPLHDLQQAIRLVRLHAQEWGVDPQRIAVLGFSAGGHLVCSAACFGDDGNAAATDPLERLSSRPNALVACYPVVSFGPRGHQGSKNHLLGAKAADPAMVHDLSLENAVTKAHPPTFLWHTSDDSAVPVDNSLLYGLALAKAGVQFELQVYPHGSHGLGLAPGKPLVEGWSAACAAWFKYLGWDAPAAP